MRRDSIVFLTILFSAAAAAHGGSHGTPVQESAFNLDNPDQLAQQYNQHADALPSVIASLIGDERINLHLETSEGKQVFGIVMDGTRIDTVTVGGVDNATLTVRTDLQTVSEIASAEQPAKRAVQALRQDKIRYETVGLVRTIKFGILTGFLTVFGALS